MLNYLKAELYKVTHRKYLYIFLAVMLAFEGLLICLCAAQRPRVAFGEAVILITPFLILGMYFSCMFVDAVFSEQYKAGTLKNETSFGISRATIYLGKLAGEMLVAAATCAIMLGAYMGLCRLVLPAGAEDGMLLALLVRYLLVALPLWVGSLGLLHLLTFLIPNATVASVLYVCVITMLAPIVRMVGNFGAGVAAQAGNLLYKLQLNAPFDAMAGAMDKGYLGWSWAVGLGWLAATTVVGLALFQRREMK